MVKPKAYEEVVDFIARGGSPAWAALVAREKAVGLTADERSELDHYLQLEHIMRLAKARAATPIFGKS
jgi:hypothetical protein